MANNDITNVDEFDIDQAQKLLESIRYISDMRKFPVLKPNSTTMERTTMQIWVKWYYDTTEYNGQRGTEYEVIKMIEMIDLTLQMVSTRVEEGFRKLLSVIDRKDLQLQLTINELEKYKEELRLIKIQNKVKVVAGVEVGGGADNADIQNNIDDTEDTNVVVGSQEEQSQGKSIEMTPVTDKINLGIAIRKK